MEQKPPKQTYDDNGILRVEKYYHENGIRKYIVEYYSHGGKMCEMWFGIDGNRTYARGSIPRWCDGTRIRVSKK